MKRYLSIWIVLSLALSAGCSKEKGKGPDNPAGPGKISIRFNYTFGGDTAQWSLGRQVVHPRTGDTLTFSAFKFYISNIRLRKDDNTWWNHPDSYFLADASGNGQRFFPVENIPAGIYTEMEYMMGVDSAKNVSGAHNGALSLGNGMYWDWNSGYIMIKAEGRSPQSPTSAFSIHPGGFSGADNITTIKRTDFNGRKLEISSAKDRVIYMTVDPAAIWHNAPGVSEISALHDTGPAAIQFANGFYEHGIRFGEIGE